MDWVEIIGLIFAAGGIVVGLWNYRKSVNTWRAEWLYSPGIHELVKHQGFENLEKLLSELPEASA
ncbi:MAG TPA: hypothetical protein VM617_05975 [Thermoanaerobaculia bacterium]|nr:hypothetical protein [Thermoanaerobaculia bacterium]